MSITLHNIDDYLHIQVVACDRFSCQMSVPTPYADGLDPNADELLAWARKMAMQVTQSNTAWGVYHTYGTEELAKHILDGVTYNRTVGRPDEGPKEARKQPIVKVDDDAWERHFRAIMEGV